METKSSTGDGAQSGTRHLTIPKLKIPIVQKIPGTETLFISKVPSIKLAVGNPAPSENIDLDHVQPLEPDSFPNAPEKEGNSVKATIANVQHLLRGYKISVGYDVIKKQMRTILPGQVGSSDNASNVALTQILSLATLNRMSSGPVPAIIETLADRNLYNPVADWIMSKPWDGLDRLQSFCSTLVERDDYPEVLKQTLMRRWLLGAVAAALKPTGFSARGILTLQGSQSIGRTSWIRALVPDPLLRERALKRDRHLYA